MIIETDSQQTTFSNTADSLSIDPINYLAIDLLEQLNNLEPTNEEIHRIEQKIKEKLKELKKKLMSEKQC